MGKKILCWNICLSNPMGGQENNYNFTLKKLYKGLSLNLPWKITTEVLLHKVLSI